MGLGAFCNFSTEATGVSQKFPGIRPYLATLAGNFRMPILRDYLMSGGKCKSTLFLLLMLLPLSCLPLQVKRCGRSSLNHICLVASHKHCFHIVVKKKL